MKEREEILRFLRRRERAGGLMGEERSAVLKADIKQLTTQDEVWAAATEACPGGGQQGAGCNRRALQGTQHPQMLCPQPRPAVERSRRQRDQ
jgi:hypothetical protein